MDVRAGGRREEGQKDTNEGRRRLDLASPKRSTFIVGLKKKKIKNDSMKMSRTRGYESFQPQEQNDE